MKTPKCKRKLPSGVSWSKRSIETLVGKLTDSYDKKKGINHLDGLNIPVPEKISDIIKDYLRIIFPGFIGKESVKTSSASFYAGTILDRLHESLVKEIKKALEYQCPDKNTAGCDCADASAGIAAHVLKKLPEVRRLLKLDVEAAYAGDPAARSYDEIILSYPFIKAISVHRFAHELYKAAVPLIPRMASEWSHTETGIDIHPGAEIGESFFIDHGTGVVIGETTQIGRNVKIYQGVTLGALSFPRDERGKIIKGVKRHPTLKDHVTVYANATILGGDTVIGERTVIGGNTWITKSVEADMIVNISAPDLVIRKKAGGRKKK
ncbi:MAG: serine O-acetyltransferase EpsC [Fibrobacterota bacterium]